MELGSIEREVYVEASPAVVYEVVSRPEHLREWWPDDARLEARPGAPGVLVFGTDAEATTVSLSVVEADPPHTFSFRWTHDAGEGAATGNSLLVTFALMPQGSGTRLRMTETGFRERGWEAAVLREEHDSHARAWDHYLPQLAPYAVSVAAQR